MIFISTFLRIILQRPRTFSFAILTDLTLFRNTSPSCASALHLFFSYSYVFPVIFTLSSPFLSFYSILIMHPGEWIQCYSGEYFSNVTRREITTRYVQDSTPTLQTNVASACLSLYISFSFLLFPFSSFSLTLFQTKSKEKRDFY